MNEQEINALTFEQAYSRLQEVVEKLEAGNLPLNEALTLYQTGMSLAQRCNQQLDQAELSIKSISPSGGLVEFEDI